MARPRKKMLISCISLQQHIHASSVTGLMIVFLQRPIDRDTEQYQEKCMQDVRNFPHIFVRVRVRSGTLMKWFNELKRYLAQADP